MPANDLRRVPDALRVRAQNHPDRIAHDDTRRALSFAEWHTESNAVGGGLAAASVQPGDRVLLPISNQNAVEFAIAFMAVMRAGGIAVPLNTRLLDDEISYFAELTGSRYAITNAPEKIAHLDLEASWTVDAMPRDKNALPDQDSLDAEADADIISTSGTTGRPKGVVFSHQELMQGIGDATATNPSKAIAHALPFSGFGGCHGVMQVTLRTGSSVYTQPQFDAEGFLKIIQEKQPDSIQIVPSMLRLIVDLPNADQYDATNLKWVITGTSPLPIDTVERAMKLWPKASIRNVYGMTEGGAGGSTRTRESVLKPGSVGPALPTIEIRDDEGKPLPHGQVGEIWGKVDKPRRYWNDPDASAATWLGQWVKTGDLGFVDGDGDLILTGRSKDLIIRGGYNIAPAEIEDVLHAHVAVQEAAVTGIHHDVLGEDVAAAVVLRRGAKASAEELQDWCKTRLADNKVPRDIVFLDALPYNQNAKVMKRELVPTLEEAAKARRAASP